MQDDNRGLFQGVTDNHITPHSFYLVLERKIKGCQDEANDPQASYPSLVVTSLRHHVINPMYHMLWNQANNIAESLSKSYDPVDKDLSCDIHVVTLRTMQASAFKTNPSDQSALIVHRQGFNGCYKPVGMTCSTNGGKVRTFEKKKTLKILISYFKMFVFQISLEELFPELYSSNVKQMSLSLLYDGLKVEKGFTVSIKPMEVYSFLLRR